MKLFFKALKILLILILFAGLGVGLWLLDRHMHWPWWAGAAIFVGILGLILGLLFLQRYLIRRREKKFVQRIVERDETLSPKKPLEQRFLLDLDARFRKAVEVLKRSHLRSRGNPLYVLPWFLMLGRSGVGKTAAAAGADLASPMTEVSPESAGGPTNNVDWWFFEQAVVMDTTGRYTVPSEPTRDNSEWQRFLTLLSKYRRKEPISGVLVVVGLDSLLESESEVLAEEARAVRRRVDDVMRVLGARLPVYILLSQADRLPGLVQLADRLPEEARQQAFGRGSTQPDENPKTFVRDTLEAVGERIKALRLLLLESHPDTAADMLILPEEIGRLEEPLRQFVLAAFEENPYQETPILRGIYFASARQAGEIESRTINAEGAFAGHRIKLPNTRRGLFLADLFAEVLPSDRGIKAPLKEYLSWRSFTQRLGLLAWIAVFAALAGAVTLSFQNNTRVLGNFTQAVTSPPTLGGDLQKNLILMDSFRSRVQEMSAANKGWWVPRLGLNQSLEMEAALKEYYCGLFRHGFLDRLDRSLTDDINGFNAQTPGAVIGSYVGTPGNPHQSAESRHGRQVPGGPGIHAPARHRGPDQHRQADARARRQHLQSAVP